MLLSPHDAQQSTDRFIAAVLFARLERPRNMGRGQPNAFYTFNPYKLSIVDHQLDIPVAQSP